ncbi:uncharacterized protein FYW47_005340 [Aplochiton taeniatus]
MELAATWPTVNLTLIITIIQQKGLHEPMYIFICNLSINSLYGTVGFYPMFLHELLSDIHVISYAIIRICLNSAEGRIKFTQTCVPHLTTIIVFVIAALSFAACKEKPRLTPESRSVPLTAAAPEISSGIKHRDTSLGYSPEVSSRRRVKGTVRQR